MDGLHQDIIVLLKKTNKHLLSTEHPPLHLMGNTTPYKITFTFIHYCPWLSFVTQPLNAELSGRLKDSQGCVLEMGTSSAMPHC